MNDDRSDSKIFIGGLAPHTTEYTLAMHFSGYGQIVESKIVTDKATGRSKGFGFVTFVNPHAAALAVANPSPFIDGKTCNCNLASASKTGPGAPGAQGGAAGRQGGQSNPRESFVDSLKRQGEDVSPATIEAKVIEMYKESPTRALKWFLERAEVFRGTPDMQYWMTNLVALAREYREKGTVHELPAKGSDEALSIQKQQEEIQAQAQAGATATTGEQEGGAEEQQFEQPQEEQ